MSDFLSVAEVSEVISSCEKQTSHSYSSAFSKKSLEKSDDWWLLSQIFQMHQRFDDKDQPYGPMMTMTDGRRSLLPEDLTKAQLGWLNTLEIGIDEPEFCARLSDLAWLLNRDSDAAVRCVRYYLEAGFAVEDLDHWTQSIERYTRAYRLATQLGRSGTLRDEVLDFLLGRLREVKGDDPRWWSLKIILLLYEAKHGDIDELIQYARLAAERAKIESDFRRLRNYLDFIAKHYQKDRNVADAEAILVEIAQSFLQEAEDSEKNGGGLNSRHHWEATVKAFRERPSLRGQVPELKKRLASASRETLGQMQQHTHSTDISEIIMHLKDNFSDTSKDEAFYKLISFSLNDPDDLRREAEEAKNNFFASMFESRQFDYEGRTVAVTPGALYPDDPGYEERIKSDIQSGAAIRRGFSVQAQIVQALRIVLTKHSFDQDYLEDILADSAFIPEGRIEYVAEGLGYGFKWQFMHAALFLVPQFEAGLRNFAVQLGLTPRNLSASGVEDAWGLDRLLSEDLIKTNLGKELTFELRSLLIEDYGPKFRHNLLHGLIPPNAMNGNDAVYAWWLFLKICVVPTSGFQAFIAKQTAQNNK